MYDYDTAVFIGKFAPWHNGHNEVLKEAQRRAKNVLIIIGSCNSSLRLRIPFTYEERKSFIKAEHPEPNIKVVGCPDYPYSDSKWVNKIQELVNDNTSQDDKICLIGHSKDSTSFYLNMFPKWGSVEVVNYKGLNATDIRKMIFEYDHYNASSYMPYNSYMKMSEVCESYEFSKLHDEWEINEKYKNSWSKSPFQPQFITGDAVVYQSGHILTIIRKSKPGQGLMALPGGFINSDERIIDGIIRELKEETKIKVPKSVLYGSIKKQHVFDEPFRSDRGRTVSHGAFIVLPDGPLPKVTAADDAQAVQWVKTSDLREQNLFEDHYHIIDYFTQISN